MNPAYKCFPGLALAALLGAGLLPPAVAAVPDSVRIQGERLAQSQCSACHVVAQNQEYPPLLKHPAPSFDEIANRPDTTEKSLLHTIGSAHWDLDTMPMTMPNQELGPQESRAVARYILGLRKH